MESADRRDLTPDERQRYEAIIERFEQAWHRSGEQQISKFLSSAGDLRSLLVQELIQIDREFRDDQSLVDTASLGSAAAEKPANSSAGPRGGDSRFRILRPHAKGGLGEVFVAQDGELQREVALKQIKPRYADDVESRSRFLREALITGGLEHPGIVPVYGLGADADGRPFYAMRFIRGDSLHAAIARFHNGQHSEQQPATTPATTSANVASLNLAAPGRMLELRELLGRFVDVCQAIAYAHSRGVLHRDLKPSNVMLGEYGETLVVDWGLAKVIGSADGATEVSSLIPPAVPHRSSTAHTRTGSTIGTPAYMSPEQASGRFDLLGKASDIFSLGATLYQILTGSPPQTSRDFDEVLANVQRGVFPQPRELKHDVPKPLAAICLKAMAREPEQRYETAEALASDVERYLADEPIKARAEPPLERLARLARRHRHWFQAAGLALALIAVVAVVAYVREASIAEANRRLALDKSNLANRNLQLAAEKGALAEREQAKSRSLQLALAQNTFERGITEFDAGREDAGLEQMQRGWELASSDDVWRESVTRVLIDRSTRSGQYLIPPLRHEERVYWAAVSSDGARIATASGDQTARLWDARTGAAFGKAMLHDNAVYHVEFSPDNSRLATASFDGTARLWNANTGEPIAVMRHGDSVLRVAFIPRSNRLATASYDKTARLWDASTGAPMGETMRHDDQVWFVAASPDGTKVATASFDKTARLWNAETGAPLGQVMQHDWGVAVVTFSPDSTRLATGSWDNTARLWKAETGEPLGNVIRQVGSVDHILFSPDSNLLATTVGSSVRLSDARTGLQVGAILSHDRSVNSLAFSPDGVWLATASFDRTARLWDVKTGARVGAPMRHEKSVSSVAFSPDAMWLITTSDDKTARCWDVRSGTPVRDMKSPRGGAGPVAFSPDGNRLATGGNENFHGIWDPQTGAPVSDELQHDNGVWCLEFSSDSSRLVTAGTRDSTIRLWDGQTGAPVGKIMHHRQGAGGVRSVAFSPDGKRLASGGADGIARLWDASTGNPIGKPVRHENMVFSVAFAPDGKLLATGSLDQTVRLLDGHTGVPLGDPIRHDERIGKVAFSPDGERLVTAGKTAQLWNVRSRAPIGEPMRHESTIEALAFSPDGSRLATGSSDLTARIWDAHHGQPLGVAMHHDDKVQSLAFSPDGHLLATASPDSTVRFWDARTGAPLGKQVQHPDSVYDLAFSPDGARLATTCRDSVVRLWTTPRLKIPPEFPRWLRLQTGRVLSASLEMEPMPLEQWHAERAAWQVQNEAWFKEEATRNEQLLRANHLYALARALDEQDFFAARFHRQRVIEVPAALEFQWQLLQPVAEFLESLPTNLALRRPGVAFPRATASFSGAGDPPTWSNDGGVDYQPRVRNRWTAYGSKNSSDWLQIEFAEDTDFQRVALAIYDEGPNNGVQTPESYAVEYWEAGQWKEVAGATYSPPSPAGNRWNEVRFQRVKSKKVRVVFTHREGAKSGVVEIAIWP